MSRVAAAGCWCAAIPRRARCSRYGCWAAGRNERHAARHENQRGDGALQLRRPRVSGPARRHRCFRIAGRRRPLLRPQRQVPPPSRTPRRRPRGAQRAAHGRDATGPRPQCPCTYAGAEGRARAEQPEPLADARPRRRFAPSSGRRFLRRGLLLQDVHLAEVAHLRASHPKARRPRRRARRLRAAAGLGRESVLRRARQRGRRGGACGCPRRRSGGCTRRVVRTRAGVRR